MVALDEGLRPVPIFQANELQNDGTRFMKELSCCKDSWKFPNFQTHSRAKHEDDLLGQKCFREAVCR